MMERRKLVDYVYIRDMPHFVCFWTWRKDTYMYANDSMRLFKVLRSDLISSLQPKSYRKETYVLVSVDLH